MSNTKIITKYGFIGTMKQYPNNLPLFLCPQTLIPKKPRVQEGWYNPKTMEIYKVDTLLEVEHLKPCLIIV